MLASVEKAHRKMTGKKARTGKVADAVLMMSVLRPARRMAPHVRSGGTSYSEAITKLVSVMQKEADRQNIQADCEMLCDAALNDALRVVDMQCEMSLFHLMDLASAMKEEGMSQERITAWVRMAALKSVPDALGLDEVTRVIAHVFEDDAEVEKPAT